MSFGELTRRRRTGAYGYLSLPGTTGNYATAASSAAGSVTGNIDIRLKVALTDWTPSANMALLAKYGAAGQRSYLFYVGTTGIPYLQTFVDGTTSSQAASSAATGVTDGAVKWIRVTRSTSTGGVKFYLSDDGATWTQLGTNSSNSPGAIFASTELLNVGAATGGTLLPANGKFYRVQIRSNILDDGTGIVFDADFTNTGRTFVEPASGATMTVNGTTARASVYP